LRSQRLDCNVDTPAVGQTRYFRDRISLAEIQAMIRGLVGSPSERKALIALAEGVPGVTVARDEMIAAYE
jgi:hypothetical protein